MYYSAAARTLVARGERCDRCGGRLLLADDGRPVSHENALGGNGEPSAPPPTGSAA